MNDLSSTLQATLAFFREQDQKKLSAPERVRIAHKSLLSRARQELASNGMRLCAAREGSRLHQNVGRYYALDSRNVVSMHHIDLNWYA